MLSFIKNSPGASPGYLDLRKAGRALISKIYQTPVSHDYDMLKAARKLTLPTSGRTLVFDGETDMNALADFWIHEFRVGGRTLIERCDAGPMGLGPLEGELLAAHQQSRTSLFETVEVRPSLHQVLLRDLLEPVQPEFLLTDHGLSASIAEGPVRPLLFLRVITVREFNMTSGVSFVFRPERKPELLRAYQQRMTPVGPKDRAERRFVFFYQAHRAFGEQQVYEDVAGTP